MTVRRKEVFSWLEYAGVDLQSAMVLKREGIFAQACFHAQQCVEKSLKAFLVFQNTPIMKTHNLKELLEACVAAHGEKLKKFAQELVLLDLFYVPTRYPDGFIGSLPHRLPNETECQEAITTAETVYAVIQQEIHRAESKG